MEIVLEEKNWITINEAATTLGSTIPRLLMLIKKGTLIGQQVEGEWYVTRDSIGTCTARDELSPSAVKSCGSGCGGCGGK